MDIATKLRRLRAKKGNTATELAKLLDVSSAAVSQWESGRQNPAHDKLIKIAEYYDVSLDFLMGNEETPKKVINFKTNEGIKIPVLGEIVAGVPISAIQEILDYEEIPAEWARQGEFFGLRVKGSSMEPSLRAGDTVILKQQQSCDDGNICAVLVGNENATLKRVYKNEFGITLKAENKAEFQDKSYSNREIETLPVTIIGVAVEVRRKLI